MITISICFLVFSIIFIIIGISYFKKGHQINLEGKAENQRIDELNSKLKQESIILSKEISDLQKQAEFISLEQEKENKRLKEIQEQSKTSIENFKEITEAAMHSYYQTLDAAYIKKEQEFDSDMELLKKKHNDEILAMNKEKENEQKVLDSIRATRVAAQQAQIKEKKIKANMDFYCLIPSRKDLQDYDKLNSIRPMLNNDRILAMLIWQTYFQPLAKKQFPQILGTGTKTGIYKITNQLRDKSYIGQSVDIDKRWKDHCKCGLGIDTPVGNKLYKAMSQDGLQNFSFELLEECPREQLNEKEKFYIELYDSYNYGYNSNKGVGK